MSHFFFDEFLRLARGVVQGRRDQRLEIAPAELGIDPARSFVVGDRWADVQAAREFGARAVLVRSGYGRTSEANPRGGVSADSTADNLMGAIAWIFQQS